MNFFKRTNETFILAINPIVLEEREKIWREKCSRRAECYQKYNDLIEYLEASLEILTDPIDQKKIQKQIKKLKKLRNFYAVPSILSVHFDGNYEHDIESKHSVLKIKKEGRL